MGSVDPWAVSRWAKSQQREFLLRDFYTFAQYGGICLDLPEAEFRESCDFLEGMLPDTPKIREWRKAQRRPRLPPPGGEYPSRGTYTLHGVQLEPRRTYKTTRGTALLIFAMLIDPDIRIALGRAKVEHANSSLSSIKSHLERNQTLQSAFGNLRALYERWSENAITFGGERRVGIKEATIITTGLNSAQTGQRFDLVWLDDLVDEKNFESPAEMDAARRLIHAFEPILEFGGSILVQGTRWGDNDLYGKVLDEDRQRIEDGKHTEWNTFIRGAYADDGKLNYPSILSDSFLNRMRGNTPVKLFSAWYLNQARAEGEDIFTTAYIQYVDGEVLGGPAPTLHLENTHANADAIKRLNSSRIALATVLLVDPAPTVGKHSDFTGINVVGFDAERNWFALAAYEVKKLPTERLELIIYLAVKYSVKLVAIENADMDAPLLEDKLRERSLNCRVVSFNPRQDRKRITTDAKLSPHGRTKKEAQIEALEPVLRARRVFFLRGQTAPLVRQLMAYPYLDHDDVLDSFSMAKAYEEAPEVRKSYDPEQYFKDIDRREYALEGIDFDDTPEAGRGQSAGLGSSVGKR